MELPEARPDLRGFAAYRTQEMAADGDVLRPAQRAGSRALPLRARRAVAQRKRDLPEGSFSAALFRAGDGPIADKIVEEAQETAAALRTEGRERTVSELTDLLYAMLVLATHVGATADEVRALARPEARRRSSTPSAARRSLSRSIRASGTIPLSLQRPR